MIYLKKNISGYYVEFAEPLNGKVFELGTTYKDFCSNKWIPLTEEQVKFHEENPNASAREVIWCKLDEIPPIPEKTLEEVKQLKVNEINSYDNSESVNQFTINGEIKAWFTPEERSNYKNSIDSAKVLGIENLQIIVDDNLLELPTDKAVLLLAMIQLYADTCYIVTKQHITAVNALETIEDVKDYDYTVGYPQKLNFDLV